MKFKEWLLEQQDWAYMGQLSTIIGTGDAETLNYGGSGSMSPMLYVPLKGEGGEWSSVIKSIRKTVDKWGIRCDPDPSKIGGFDCSFIKPESGKKIPKKDKTNIMWTGESHVTVAYGNELEYQKNNLIEKYNLPEDSDLKDVLLKVETPELGLLFPYDGAYGVNMPVYPPKPEDVKIIAGIAKSFKSPSGSPPIAVIVPVVCANIKPVRESLGLKPPAAGYTTHVTIGYIMPEKSPEGVLTSVGSGETGFTAKDIATKGSLALQNK